MSDFEQDPPSSSVPSNVDQGQPGWKPQGYPPGIEPPKGMSPTERVLAFLVVLALLGWLVQSQWGKLEPVWGMLKGSAGVRPKARTALSSALSQHEAAGIAQMESQQQAERLLERAINHYPGAADSILSDADTWRGSIRMTPALKTLETTALNSADLQVREAGIEIELAAYNVAKTPESVSHFIQMAAPGGRSRTYAVWTLGLLGNRDVEPARVRETLTTYLQDSDAQVRHWTVEGLAVLGGEEVITPLLHVLHDDPSGDVRERAACGLAQSGMLTSEQRKKAVPHLLNYLDDPKLDAATRGWVYQALRDITGKNLPNEPAAWRDWYAREGQSRR